MTGRVSGLKAHVQATMRQLAIPPEMEQSLTKEFVHLHILSALSEAGVLDQVVFPGDTALRLCYGGERYSEDLDFLCGANGQYVSEVDFYRVVESGLRVAANALEARFGLQPETVSVKSPEDPAAIKGDDLHVAAWQLIVPVEATPRSPKSRIKVEFANVPSYDNAPRTVRSVIPFSALPTTILKAETPREILADKAVALIARAVLKHRDVWDVWFLTDQLRVELDQDLVARKLMDYSVGEVGEKIATRISELESSAARDGFLAEMSRFLPARTVADMTRLGQAEAMLGVSANLLRSITLPRTHKPS